MFTQQELQLVIQTLNQRREWLLKNRGNVELSDESQPKNGQILEVLDSALQKLKLNLQDTQVESGQKKRSAQTLRAELSPDKIRVLIAEDDSDVAMLISTYLLAAGIKNVDIASDGIKAVTMMFDANRPYHLILCDWNMPLKNGLDVHSAVRASERYQHACFMLLSGVSEAKKIRSAIEEGVDDYLVKPVEPQVLLRKIQRLFPLVV